MPRLSLAAAVLASMLLSACAGNSGAVVSDAQRDTVWESNNGYVWLVPSERDAAANDHPVTLDAADVERLLASMVAANAEGRGLEAATGADHEGPVFTRDMRERLAQPLSDALARARPNQDVILTVRGFRALPGSSRIGNTVVSSARVFHRDDALHVMVGELNRRIEREFPFQYTGPTDLSRRGSDARFGSRTESDERRGWQLVNAPGVNLAHDNGTARSDYVLVALDADPARGTEVGEPAPPEPAAEPRPEPPTAAPEEPAAGPPTEMPAADEPATEELPASRREELRELRELYDEGLIPESVYHERVREILAR